MGGVLAAANQKISDRDDEIQQLESKIQNLESQIAERDAEFAAVAADREELAQLKKEAKEAAAEIHREGRSIELEKARWQQQLSDAKSELADAKATILKQNDKIRELERGFSLKPNPKETALRLEIGELRSQLEDLQQNSAPAIELPEDGDLLSRVRRIEPRNKKEKVAQETIDLPIIKLIQRASLELMEGEQ